MAVDNRNSRDLAITEGRYAMVLDRTKGHVETLTGPYKSSLADTQTPVVFDPDSRSGYRECDTPQEAVQPYVIAKQGQYAVLCNPSKEKESEKEFPPKGKGSLPSTLDIGNAINITGPITFALWWQQQAEVIDSHQLRSNQFLLVEVTNETQAKLNWKKAEIKPAIVLEDSKAVEKDPESIFSLDPSKFTLGQRIIVRGLEISSFIPPTGMRVVPDPKTKLYVRDAATLESQQYCVLISENGKKRYCQGPAVVFPTATENFVEEKNSRVFRCIELNPNSGIHVMVIADYVDSNGKPIKSGTELFITGKDTPIYYPRPEHAIIKHDNDNFIHYATAVPEGEGRYVLGKNTGTVELRKGPNMILLDATKEIFVRRVLSEAITQLYFPGNNEALLVNQQLSNKNKAGSDYVEEDRGLSAVYASACADFNSSPKGRSMVSDVVQRKNSYTPARTLTLDNKYSGAITIAIWPGYAIQVLKKNGEARVEQGPKTVLLEYDESLTKLSLSTGKPKTTDVLQNTVYLKTSGNQVSDIVTVETSDSIGIQIKLALKVEFVGNPNNWFKVDNYVKETADHVRSILRGTVKQLSVLEFTRNATQIIRDAILGVKTKDSGRPGLNFEQNGAHVYDVEVLGVKVIDAVVERLINESQQETIRGMLEVIKKQQLSTVYKELETAERAILLEKQTTDQERHKAAMESSNRKAELMKADVALDTDRSVLQANTRLSIQTIDNKVDELNLARTKAKADLNAQISTDLMKLEQEKVTMETNAIVTRLESVNPDLIKAIESSNDRDALVNVVSQMGLSAYVKNDSVGAVLSSVLKGTSLENTVSKLGNAIKGM